MIDTKLLEMIGFYEVSSVIVFGLNLFKIVSIFEILVLTATSSFCFINIFYCLDDINEVTKFSLLIVALVITCCKLYCIVQNVEKIWTCIRLTSIDSLSYKYHSVKTLNMGRTNSKATAIFFLCLRVAVVATWIMSPFCVNGYYVKRRIGNRIHLYRYNSLNLVFPVTGEFYNDHFTTYYSFESAPFLFWGHANMTFDTLLVLMIITISYQLRTVANSYSTFTAIHDHIKGMTLIGAFNTSKNSEV